MRRLKEISLALIALILVAEFFLSHIWPAYYLKIYTPEYLDSAVACSQAMVSSQQAKSAPDILDSDLKQRLIQASRVELTKCHKLNILRNKLLSNGVKEVDLKLIDLAALENKNIPFQFFVGKFEK
tara:strand:- start:36 stop:413 length:378 start_codon:yes stop_codon:yes gene_type:complete